LSAVGGADARVWVEFEVGLRGARAGDGAGAGDEAGDGAGDGAEVRSVWFLWNQVFFHF
jgi:hypothetical protein